MYSILVSPSQGLPFVISQNSHNYCDYIAAGYETIATGTAKQMNALIDESVIAYAD